MIEVKSSLNSLSEKTEVREGYMYMIDFTKLTSVNDLILILASMGIVFPYDHPNINTLGKFLNLDNPIPLPTEQPKPPFVPLDKLDTPLEKKIFGEE
jgi:hypothetical protein